MSLLLTEVPAVAESPWGLRGGQDTTVACQ